MIRLVRIDNIGYANISNTAVHVVPVLRSRIINLVGSVLYISGRGIRFSRGIPGTAIDRCIKYTGTRSCTLFLKKKLIHITNRSTLNLVRYRTGGI